MENRKEFARKYKTEIALMAKAQDKDLGVAADMLIAHVKERRTGIKPYRYDYPESALLNLAEISKDIAELESAEDIRRAEAGV